jgi:hypothetical protein
MIRAVQMAPHRAKPDAPAPSQPRPLPSSTPVHTHTPNPLRTNECATSPSPRTHIHKLNSSVPTSDSALLLSPTSTVICPHTPPYALVRCGNPPTLRTRNDRLQHPRGRTHLRLPVLRVGVKTLQGVECLRCISVSMRVRAWSELVSDWVDASACVRGWGPSLKNVWSTGVLGSCTAGPG